MQKVFAETSNRSQKDDSEVSNVLRNFHLLVLLISLTGMSWLASGHSIVEVVKKVKPSVVGIGVHNPLGAPRNKLHGTGFRRWRWNLMW